MDVGIDTAIDTWISVGEDCAVGAGVKVDVAVGDRVSVGKGVLVDVAVGDRVAVQDAVAVRVADGVVVTVEMAVCVGVAGGIGVAVGAGVDVAIRTMAGGPIRRAMDADSMPRQPAKTDAAETRARGRTRSRNILRISMRAILSIRAISPKCQIVSQKGADRCVRQRSS
jgi:hypothetical protein